MYLFSGELAGEHITRLHVRGSVHGGGVVFILQDFIIQSLHLVINIKLYSYVNS